PTYALDFTGRPENLTVWLKDGHILVGWGNQLGASTLLTGINDYEHNVYAASVGDVTKIIGGRGADVFNVYETTLSQMILDGGKGNDTFVFWNFTDSNPT